MLKFGTCRLLCVVLLSVNFSLSADAVEGNKNKLVTWATYSDQFILFPEKLAKIKLVNNIAISVGTIGKICNDYLPSSLVPQPISSCVCLSEGMPETVTVIGEKAGSFFPYIHIYKGVKSFGTLLHDRSSDTGEDVFNILNGYVSYCSLAYPGTLTSAAYLLTNTTSIIYGVYQNKPLFDLVRTNYRSLKTVLDEDFVIKNDQSTYLTARARVDARAIGRDFLDVAEFMTTVDLTFALRSLGQVPDRDLREVLVDTYASRAFLKLKGNWVWGKYDEFFASHTSLNLENILKVAGRMAVVRTVYDKFGRRGMEALIDAGVLAPEQLGVLVTAGNTSYSNNHEIRYLDREGENPVYMGEVDDVFYDCKEFHPFCFPD